MSSPRLIDASGLTRRFGDFEAVKDVSFAVNPGEVVGFLGPNGAGKSTTMQMLCGVLSPTEGSIAIGGVDLLESPLEAKRQIGYLPEQPPLYREHSVDEMLYFCAELRGIARRDRGDAVERAKVATGLEDAGPRLIEHLSKGFQQRVGIAQAILHDPDVVVLDEPTSGLDPNQLRDIRALIRGLGERHGVILSTHILSEVQTMCDRVVMLNAGQVVLDTPIDAAAETSMKQLGFRLARSLSTSDIDHLRTLSGVTGVTANRDNNCIIDVTCDGDDDTVDAIVATLAPHGLREMLPERQSLEDVFVSLTLKGT